MRPKRHLLEICDGLRARSLDHVGGARLHAQPVLLLHRLQLALQLIAPLLTHAVPERALLMQKSAVKIGMNDVQ